MQETLLFVTPEQVEAEICCYIRDLVPGGGYRVAPAHDVESNVSPANLVTIRDVIMKHRIYPIQ